MMNSIRQIWSRLETSSANGVVRERVKSVPGLNCYIGFIGITGARIFQLEIDSELPVHKNYLRKFRGVEIQVIPFPNSRTEYTIILLEKELTDIFTMFIEDIIEKLAPIAHVQQALTSINQRVNYWRKLFSKVSGELLSAEKQRGLFGELIILVTLIKEGNNPALALDSWRGVYCANQDFALETSAIEVKTSKAGKPLITIASEHQLDFRFWDNLFLAVVLVNESSGSDHSLSSQIHEIISLLQDDNSLINVFLDKLNRVGIPEEYIDQYNDISFTIRSIRYYRVTEGFPLISAMEFMDTPISGIKYRIDMTACSEFEEVEETVIAKYL